VPLLTRDHQLGMQRQAPLGSGSGSGVGSGSGDDYDDDGSSSSAARAAAVRSLSGARRVLLSALMPLFPLLDSVPLLVHAVAECGLRRGASAVAASFFAKGAPLFFAFQLGTKVGRTRQTSTAALFFCLFDKKTAKP